MPTHAPVSASQTAPRPVVLCILDGLGLREHAPDNAVTNANTPTLDRLMAGPLSSLNASEHAVGLPAGQMGNSEVGHMNLGAGRVLLQDLPRIDAAVENGSLGDLDALKAFADKLKVSGGTAHILGLLSDGGVHSHQDHIVALAAALQVLGVPVKVHGFLDGRDTAPRAGADLVAKFEASAPNVQLATLCGRYWAMDRDKRWERVVKAYDLLTSGAGARADRAAAAVRASYDADVGDEFVEPVVIGDYQGMADGDGLLMANFRADRAREILSALLDPAFDGFERTTPIAFADALGMVSYSEAHDALLSTLFPPEIPDDVLGDVVAKAGLKQLRIAETEKYAHVTFFLNGGREAVFEGEDRILVPSPDVATYDLQPEMSAHEVTDNLVRVIEAGTYDLIVVNYANPDMVGHTGDFEAAVKAVETVDACLARLETAIDAADGAMLVTADHGNVDRMSDAKDGGPHTAHTLSRVPFMLVGHERLGVSALSDGRLADVAPTVLELMGIPAPAAMTGQSLVRSRVQDAAE